VSEMARRGTTRTHPVSIHPRQNIRKLRTLRRKGLCTGNATYFRSRREQAKAAYDPRIVILSPAKNPSA